jgi:hypothetical protein
MRRIKMKMREVYEKLVAEYPGRAVSVEYAISTFKKPCTVYVDTWEQSFQAATWERALDLAENKEISCPPDEEEPITEQWDRDDNWAESPEMGAE